MRTVKELLNDGKKVYVFLGNEKIIQRFSFDAEKEGITFGDGVKPTQRPLDDIMALNPDGTICFLGFAGRMNYWSNKEAVRIDYEKYVGGDDDYVIVSKEKDIVTQMVDGIMKEEKGNEGLRKKLSFRAFEFLMFEDD